MVCDKLLSQYLRIVYPYDKLFQFLKSALKNIRMTETTCVDEYRPGSNQGEQKCLL